MPAPGFTSDRLWLIFGAALVAGASFWPGGHLDAPAGVLLAWKGAGVALLALWAALSARNRDGWLITIALTCGAVGDVAIDALGLTAGAAAFLVGHVVAVILYARRSRSREDGTEAAILILVAVPIVAYSLSGRSEVLLYSLGLGAMAATAWISRFPRHQVGLGALLFAASDLLIFSRMGPLHASMLPDLLVWPLYFAGQALIAWGVVTTLAKERAA